MRKARHGAFLQVSRDPRCRGMIVDREPDLGQSSCSFCPPSFPDRDMNSSLSLFFFFSRSHKAQATSNSKGSLQLGHSPSHERF